MAAGIRGRLLTSTFVDTQLLALPGAAPAPTAFTRALDGWAYRRENSVGPSAGARSVADVVAIPLLALLGFSVQYRDDRHGRALITLRAPGCALPLLVTPWDDALEGAWRHAVLDGVAADSSWACCCNGRALRVVDARRTWTREYLEFDLDALSESTGARDALWSLLRAEAVAAVPAVLDVAAAASARQGIAVCRALGDGVLDALRHLLGALQRQRHPAADTFEQSLTILYRILFLLFAEARGLVPLWHPVYRERYTIAAIVSALLAGRACRGIWPALHAISRLAHAGCKVGDLTVTAFNGRLFAPARTTAFEHARVDDQVMTATIIAVATVPHGRGRARIAYGDLDVEQLGAVYEHVLDHQPAPDTPGVLMRSRDARKSTGTFYTPRVVTGHLVSRTLAPLVEGRSSADILSLRVLDPAMGSGAFLVSACRFLAAAAEQARVNEGLWHPGEVTADDRASLRREVALRCLYGVDLNPMAVQLARLSIWLATLSADRPLTFLDHHLVIGNSLVGATPDDVRRQPSRGRARSRRAVPLPLLEEDGLVPVLANAARVRAAMSEQPDDSAAIVHGKEAALASLQRVGTPLRAWSRALDLWCAGWFWKEGHPPDAATAGELRRYLLGGRSALPSELTQSLTAHSDELAASYCFLHWPLAFPEVFAGPAPGFDAVVGNPPWDMVRGDSGVAAVRDDRRASARRLADFVRESGVYRVDAGAHVNRYHLFLERALQLTRRGGRIGLVLPSGVVADAGAAALRRHLFDRAQVDTIAGLDNRRRIFPIHRSVRFVLLTATTGSPTDQISCRFGITVPEALDEPAPAAAPLVLTRRLLSRLSGDDDLGVPELLAPRDLAIVERIAAHVPPLGSAAGWHVHFGRELNATDDRRAFVSARGDGCDRPVLEGKLIDPFRAAADRATLALPSTSPLSRRVPLRPRLAYREVASATNRLTLIAAIVPARCVTTHTVFCLKAALPLDAQHVLCGLLNSFVANYLVRLRVNTHVTAALMSKLRVPLVEPATQEFKKLEALSRALAGSAGGVEAREEYAHLQARAARLYGLGDTEFEHVLGSFPLIPAEVKARALARFGSIR